MVDGVLVFVNLTEKGTNLHMRFAFVFQHFQSQRWLLWVVKVLLQVITLKVVDARFQANGALLKDTQLLVAHCHVVQSKQE